jgi:anti-anti-sigma factor
VTTAIASVSEPEFSADAQAAEGVLKLSLSGNADLNVKTMLDQLLATVHAEAQGRGVPEVEVDMRKLEFMNSSCLKCLVAWISRIQDTPPARQYRVNFRSSPALFWQKRSLQALAMLASDLVTVTA